MKHLYGVIIVIFSMFSSLPALACNLVFQNSYLWVRKNDVRDDHYWNGNLIIESVYACDTKTCFVGRMNLARRGKTSSHWDHVTGELDQRNGVTLTRYTSGIGQKWYGNCTGRGSHKGWVSGTWHNRGIYRGRFEIQNQPFDD